MDGYQWLGNGCDAGYADVVVDHEHSYKVF